MGLYRINVKKTSFLRIEGTDVWFEPKNPGPHKLDFMSMNDRQQAQVRYNVAIEYLEPVDDAAKAELNMLTTSTDDTEEASNESAGFRQENSVVLQEPTQEATYSTRTLGVGNKKLSISRNAAGHPVFQLCANIAAGNQEAVNDLLSKSVQDIKDILQHEYFNDISAINILLEAERSGRARKTLLKALAQRRGELVQLAASDDIKANSDMMGLPISGIVIEPDEEE